ncbi:YidB family protein [Acinetobacter sp. YH12058]|uniref:YidB family protein n=1 Tax=Acinetobacter sp. YH12058 TaxID=2601058 RepID=UPI0015D2F9D2|nr:YidB family protein [Acinetobacter sp. YH12058]
MTNLSNIVEILAKQALGANQQSNQSQGGLGGILGSVLGQLGGNNQQSAQGGLGGILGSVLGQLGGNNQQSAQGGLGGILGSVLGQLGGQQQRSATGASGTQSLLIAVLPLVLAWIQKQGGLQGALDKLKGQGLTSQVDDWVSTGPGENAHVGAEQVQSLFDDADVEQVAQQTQAPKQDIYNAISAVLPQIIDSLTPQGEQTSKQEANDDIQQVMNLVSGFLKR